eukprot:5036400-Pyramimonas_sp.AAC.1
MLGSKGHAVVTRARASIPSRTMLSPREACGGLESTAACNATTPGNNGAFSSSAPGSGRAAGSREGSGSGWAPAS